MRIYYYHPSPFTHLYEAWVNQEFPGHTLYGLTHFEKYGIEVVMHAPKKKYSNRLLQSLYTLKKIWFTREKYDAVYAVMFRGLELLIFMRALGLFRKPILIWHHTSVVTSSHKLWNLISRFFYSGIDEMFFFNEALLQESLQTGKVKKGKAILWGADVDFYNRLTYSSEGKAISTGKERRDFPTLISALQQTRHPAVVYVPEVYLGIPNRELLQKVYYPENNPALQVNYVKNILPFKDIVGQESAAFVVLICTLKCEYHYPVGFTSLMEAMAMGKPVITTDNIYYGIDVEKEGIGLKVAYGDVAGWVKAVNWLYEHPEIAAEMGRRAKALAVRKYNLENCTAELAKELRLWTAK